MFRYVVAKIMLTIPLLLGVTFALFVIGQLTPGDPVLIMLGERALPEEAARLRASLGLDQPWYVQYVQFVGNVPGKPLLAEAQCAHQPCSAAGQASLRQLGYDTRASPNPRIGAVPGSDQDVAVLVERTFLEALAAPPTYTLCVQRIAPGASTPGPVGC